MRQNTLRVRLLGSLDIQLGNQPLPPLDSARAESLLAYLLLHRDTPQPRQRLAFLLWPGSSEAQAQTNLRKVLHNLRRALPDADRLIEAGPRTLRWRRGAPLWLDVEEFERAVAQGRPAEAIGLYAGDLLEGRYDDWLAAERERLAALHASALERLARQHEQDHRWPEAIRCAERLIARDPLREEYHRLLIRLCQASGDRARAVRAYHVCASTLEDELGIEPAPETRAVYESIVAGGQDSRPTEKTPATPPLVGRDDERARLAAAWRAAASGRPQLVLVTGEAGVGKTRLVEELRAHAGTVTAEARGYPAEGPLAYGVATAWLRSGPVAARLSRLARPDLTELARLLPELTGQVTPPEPLPEAELRHRLPDAIGRALRAAGAPLLLIVDDAQWADAQSLSLIHYLIRSAPPARLLVVATARHEELDEHHPLTALTTALAALGYLTEIELARLSREQTALLAGHITGAPLDPAGLGRLYADSEGNPLFVVETLRPDAPAGASKVQAVIAGRLARLSPQAAGVAGVAAATGRAFTADVLAAATGLDEQAFVAALDELWRRGIFRAHGPNAYDFSHGRIRDAAYAALGPPRRRHLHLAIAQALERGGGHSFSGLSTCDDGLLIDLGGLKSVAVDPRARTARAGGGVRWGEFDAATQAHGLHTPGGRVTTTGLGGFTTGGGYGWTSSKYGLACDNLISAEVVLADGRVVRASEREHADLFWGLRGGGGNFGIVTEFEFRLHPLGPTVLAGLMVFPIERAPVVLPGWRDWADAAPDEVSTGCAVITAPPEPFVPAELHGRPVLAIPVLYVGDPEDGAAAVQPLRDLGPALDRVGPMPYTAFQAILDPFAPRGFRSYVRGEYLSGFGDAAIGDFLAHAPGLASAGAPLSQMVVFRIGQGIATVPDEATAFSHRDARYLFHPISIWADPADDERMIAANRAFTTAMRPFGTGAAYLNFTPEADRVRDAYGDAKYARLVALKDRYDPANVFRLNQNIRPSRPAAEPALA